VTGARLQYSLTKLVIALAVMVGCVLPLWAQEVNLTLFNSTPLLDADPSTSLEGVASSGDLVQLILAGTNGTIDTPSSSGMPGGDDVILTAANNPTHVGTGMTTTNSGMFAQVNLRFDATHAGKTAYVRFWNEATAAAATHYGNTMRITLPSADAFGEAEADAVPSASDPRTADSRIPKGTIFRFALNAIHAKDV
jgi:hypothetical protein